jgi:long-chain acyl-CoA synthetase
LNVLHVKNSPMSPPVRTTSDVDRARLTYETARSRMSNSHHGIEPHAASGHVIARSSVVPPPVAHRDARGPLDVARLLDGARLLVLGGTGFVGKVFWVMLLARYPEIGKIYLLVRSGKGRTSEQRFWSDVATSDCLSPLREQHGERFEDFLREKIVPIDGDVGRERCGVSAKLIDELRGSIDAVVNVAGVVDFSPPLDEALHANAFGSQNLVALARALGDVPLMHTSTCYVAGRRKGPIQEVDPRTVPFPRFEELGADLWDPDREIADCLDLIKQAEHRCDDAFRQSGFAEQAKKNLLAKGEPTEGPVYEQELAKVRRKYVSDRLVEAGTERATHWGWPNTYTYTKSIGEQVIARSGLPFTIVRPACCESCLEFPSKGWNEGISTSVPIIFLAMKGAVFIPAKHVELDFIPTDLVCAGMILSLAELLEGTQRPVYQYGASDVNPVTAARLAELIGLYKRKYFQRRGKGNPFLNMLASRFETDAMAPSRFNAIGAPAQSQAISAVAKLLRPVTFLRPVTKSLEGMAKQEQRVGGLMNLFAPFTSLRNGPFSCANTQAAYDRANEADQRKLPWRPEAIDWMSWMMDVHLPGVEKWILPEMEKKLHREPKALRPHQTLVTLVDQMAERHDLALAFQRLEADGLSRVTFADVKARTGAVAARLQAHGIGAGDRVLLSGHNHPDWPLAYFGILRAGATAVPVDPALESDQLENLLRESGARVAIWDDAVEKKGGAKARAALPAVKIVDLHEIAAADPSLVPEPVEVRPDDVASLIFTSGTTGSPKGVLLTHANFTALIAALAPIFPLGSGDRVMSILPLHHTFEFTCGLLLPFSRGARVAYLDELTGDRLAEGLKAGRITAMVGVPAVWQLLERRILAQIADKGAFAESVFEWAGELNRKMGKSFGFDAGKVLFAPVHAGLGGHVKWLISGGAALPQETQKRFASMGLHLTEGYGLTEASPVLTVTKPSPKAKLGSVGKPVPGVEIKILDPDGAGVGEVLARGPNVMKGYTDAEATARVLDDKGWLHTGDLGKLDDRGQLVLVGRVKDVVVTANGENVYPDDVENKLGTVAGISEYAIVGVSGRDGAERVACLAVPERDEDEPEPKPGDSLAKGAPNEEAARKRAARNERASKALRDAIAKLPYGMQPAVVQLYEAKLPRTATRKVKRPEVRAILERTLAAQKAHDAAGAETTPVRQAIAAVTGKLHEAIAPTATLQEDLGFDSLTLTELLGALEAKYGALDPAALQACKTVADVEQMIERRKHVHVSRTKTIEGRGAGGLGTLGGLKLEDVKLPEPVREIAKGWIGKLQDAFYNEVMQPKVTGRGFIPWNKRTIVVANHASHLDMGFVRTALGAYGDKLVSLAAQDYFFEGGGLKKAFFENLTNVEPLDRRGMRQAIRQAGEVLGRGHNVLIFPEGTRSNGDVQEFKSLVGYLALKHEIDVLPVFLGGTREAMPKGAFLPKQRELTARIGPPFLVTEMKRLTAGLHPSDAAREVARLLREAVLALRDGEVLHFEKLQPATSGKAIEAPKREHPMVRLFGELPGRFRPGQVDKLVSFYFTLGGDDQSKWTVRVDDKRCEVENGKPAGGQADCVLKTTPEIFSKIVREAYVPGATEFLSGAIKSNDVGLLQTFQKVFALG